MTNIYYQSVSEFMRTFDQHTYPTTLKTPAKLLQFRGDLIDEEYLEYLKAQKFDNLTEQLDGLCDLIYVTAGTLITCGLQCVPISTGRTLASLVNDCVDECYQPRPCHQRLYEACNMLITRIEAEAKGKFDLLGAFKTVHENNMEKLWPHNPEKPGFVVTKKGDRWLVKNLEGKVIKSAGHTKPNLAPFILSSSKKA